MSDFFKAAREIAATAGHPLVNTGHLLVAIVRDGCLDILQQVNCWASLAALYEILPPEPLDEKFAVGTAKYASPNFLTLEFNHAIGKFYTANELLLALLSMHESTMARAILRRLNVDQDKMAEDLREKIAGPLTAATWIDTALTSAHPPLPHPDAVQEAAQRLRQLSHELPGLRYSAAIRLIHTGGLVGVSDEAYLEAVCEEGQKEAKGLNELADKLHKIPAALSWLNETIGGGNFVVTASSVDRSVFGYGNTRIEVKVDGVVPSIVAPCKSLGLDSPEPSSEESIDKARFEMLQTGGKIGERLLDPNKTYSDEEANQMLVDTGMFAQVKDEEVLFAWSDGDSEGANSCPNGHHKLEGECHYDYCSCCCTRCKAQCEKYGR